MNMLTGTFVWFDSSSGEGKVQTDSGELLYVHYTCIAGIDKNGYAAPTAADQVRLSGLAGQACRFTVYDNLYSRRVDTLELGGAA